MNAIPSLRQVSAANHANVTVLPTAVPRQVRQNYNRAAFAARQAIREACPWPGKYLHPGQRAAIEKAQVLSAVEQTPALLIVTALMAAMDDETLQHVLMALAPAAVVGCKPAVQAVAAVKASRMTVGEQLDLDFAFRHLRGESVP